MGKIERVKKSKTINFKENRVSYFECTNKDSNLEDYSFIINKIKNAEKCIKLFSSSDISRDIIESLYMNEIVHTYIILSSFEKCKKTVESFNNTKPIIIREVPNILNNFIIIDNISYLYVNPLSSSKNLVLNIEEEETKDLNYIFNYYFWNHASKEKLVNNISDPIESPFPPFELKKQKYINICNSQINNCIDIYIPKDKRYCKELDSVSKNKYFSSDIQNVVEKNIDSLKIGNILLQGTSLIINNTWILKSNKLTDIDKNIDIIPKNDDWNKIINILDNKVIELEDVEAFSIENMNKTEPHEFNKEKYIKSITYNWQVLAPKKDSIAVESLLYNDFKKLENDFSTELDLLENNVNSIIQESELIASFLGTNRKANNYLKKIQEYKINKLSTLPSNKLYTLINEDFKNLKIQILDSSEDFKYDKEKKKAEDIWKDKRELKNKTLEKMKNENEEIDGKENEQLQLCKRIKQLEKEIKDSYTNFNYKVKINEISQLHKKQKNNHTSLIIPKYILPELGKLYETKSTYFLEITKRSDLEKANDLAKRYIDKEEFRVVVGEYNE